MGDLTPFQNQVLDAAAAEEHRLQEEKREEAKQEAGNGRQRNSRSTNGPSGGSKLDQEETVRYVNKDENPDHEIHNSE